MSKNREGTEPTPSHYQSEDWIRNLLGSRQLDHATAADVSVLDATLELATTDVPVRDIIDAQYDIDPGILLKNELLLMLLEQAGNRSLHIDDMLALFERQAQGEEDPDGVRYRQLRGILDVVALAARNRGLIDGLKTLEPEITPENK